MLRCHLGAAASVFLLLLAFPVAALGDNDALDEIVVSADLRPLSLDALPASVAVIDEAAIRESSSVHFEQLGLQVANLHFAGGSNRARYFQIRGIGERSQYEGAPNPSVGFVIDDVDFSAIGGISSTWDLERVEVLRGPQAARYGANALAGLIYLRSAAPTAKPTAKVRIQAGNDNLTDVAAALSGPITSALRYRVSAQSSQSDGFRRNAFLGRDDTNGRDEQTIRARLQWTPGDDTTLELSAWYADYDNGYDAFAIDNGFTTYSDNPGRDAQRTVAGSARLVHDVSPAVRMTGIVAAAESDIVFSFDADWGNQAYWDAFFAPPADAPFETEYDYFSARDRVRRTASAELRFESGPDGRLFDGRADWIVGAYAVQLDESLAVFDRGAFSDGSFELFTESRNADSDYESTSTAVFGQLDVDVSEVDTLSAGIRFERRRIDYRDSDGLDLSPTESAVGGHLRWRRLFSDRWSGYVGVARGFRLGGFNLGEVPEGRREFDAEFLWNFEMGVHLRYTTGSLRAAVFHARRRDQQVDTSFQLVPGDPSTFVFFVDNAASGENNGLELEWQQQFGERWTAFATLGLLDATFDEFTSVEVDLSGREQAHAPDYTAAGGVAWSHPAGWFARVDASAKDRFFFSNSHDRLANDQLLTNAQIGFARDRWSVSVWGRNLGDERYATRGFFFGNEPPAFAPEEYLRLGDPRQYGVRIDWRYE